MEGIPIYYVMQPSTDDSLNVFFLPPQYKSQADIKIKDVVSNFPHRDSGRFFHYRFYALCDKDQKTWVDISNMSAKAPVVDNRILLKVLEVEKPHYSKLFAAVSKVSREEPAPQQPEPTRQQQQQQQQQQPRTDSMNSSGVRQNRANTANASQTQERQQQQQQPPVNVTSPPKNQQQSQPKAPVNVKSPPPTASHYEDLLGGDHSETFSQTTTVTATTTTTRVAFGSPQGDLKKDDSEVTKNMTRDQLTAYKAEKMDQAIQEKLAFANKIWDDENKNQEEKERAYNELEDSIKKWSGKNGQRNNIRALLCTLHEVAWPGSEWAPLSLTSLMMPNQIKVNFFKALTKFHPDKNSSGDYRQRYIAERVTNELNAAWDEFRKTNP